MRMTWLVVPFALLFSIRDAGAEVLNSKQVGIVTIASFTASGDLSSAQLKEIVEVIEARVDTGRAASADRVLDETLRNRAAPRSAPGTSNIASKQVPSRQESGLEVLRAGSLSPQQTSAANFIGKVTVEAPFTREAPSRIGGAIVTFQVGARTAWHVHPLGQTLIVTSGTGWVQREGGPKQEIRQGDVVWTPPGVKHWHGATTDSAMTHVAVAETLEGSQVTWLEQVSEQVYRH